MIFQPSNVIPSTFAGVGLGTIDVTDNVNISWQVNGNSPMTKFAILILDGSTYVHGTGIVSSYVLNGVNQLPFSGVDNKGNPKQFIYSPEGVTWEDWGLINGKEYIMQITQCWGDGADQSITQYSGSAFFTRAKPTLSILLNGSAFSASSIVSSAVITFTANYAQAQGDTVNAIRWEFADSEGNILDDTGFINTSTFLYTYNGLFSGNSYSVKCTAETQNGVQVTTEWISFNVEYEEATNNGELLATCEKDGSILLEWSKSVDIPGTLQPSGTPNITNNILTLSAQESVLWDKVNGLNMEFDSPWNLLWEGEIGSIVQRTYELTPVATTTNKQITVNETFPIRNLNKLSYTSGTANGPSYIAYGNGVWCGVSDFGVYQSADGKNWASKGSITFFACRGLIFDGKQFLAFGSSTTFSQPQILKINANNLASWTVTNYTFADNDGKTARAILHLSAHYINSSKIIYTAVADFGSDTWLEQHALSCVNLSNWSVSSVDINYAEIYHLKYGGAENANDIFVIDGEIGGVGKIVVNSNGSLVSVNVYTTPSNLSSTLIASDGVSNYCVAIVGTSTIYYSNNAIDWSVAVNISENSNIIDIDYNGGMFVVLFANGALWYSEDCQNWTRGSTANTPSSPSIGSVRIASANILSSVPYCRFLIYYLSSGIINTNVYETTYYKYETTLNIDGWIGSSSSHDGNSIVVSYYFGSQSIVNSPVSFTAYFNKRIVDVEFSYYVRSATASASNTFSIEDIENVSKASLVSYSPSNTEITYTTTQTEITITASIPSTRYGAPKVSAVFSITNNDLFEVGDNLILETNAYRLYVKKSDADILYNYQALLFDKDLNQYLTVATSGIYPNSGNYKIIAGVVVSPQSVKFVFKNDGKSITNYLNTDQKAITSIQLVGPQVVDELFLSTSDIDYNSNYQAVWNNNTLFFARFYDLNAGLTSLGSEAINALYRMDKNGKFIPLANVGADITKLKDYGITSKQKYYYELLYLSGAESYSMPVKSEELCTSFNAYYLIEATPDETNANLFHALKVWRFANNISAGSVSNNNTPNWLTNFTPYRLKQPSSRMGKSGTLQALLSNYNLSQNFYEDTCEMMDRLYQASQSNNTFFLKDIKGNLYMVDISAPITQTINNATKVLEVKVSIPWEEVGDASNVSIIQLPTDEGWGKDEVFDVQFVVDTSTGILSVIYPNNYMGTTFEFENPDLLANTPSVVSGANLKLENGAVIAYTGNEE